MPRRLQVRFCVQFSRRVPGQRDDHSYNLTPLPAAFVFLTEHCLSLGKQCACLRQGDFYGSTAISIVNRRASAVNYLLASLPHANCTALAHSLSLLAFEDLFNSCGVSCSSQRAALPLQILLIH